MEKKSALNGPAAGARPSTELQRSENVNNEVTVMIHVTRVIRLLGLSWCIVRLNHFAYTSRKNTRYTHIYTCNSKIYQHRITAIHSYSCIVNTIYILYICVYVSEAPFQVHLKVPRYVLVKRNVTLKCEYNAPFDHIHKVEWLKGDRKLFHYVKGRNPPFYNFTIPGGKINVSLWVFTKTFQSSSKKKNTFVP